MKYKLNVTLHLSSVICGPDVWNNITSSEKWKQRKTNTVNLDKDKYEKENERI